MRVNEGAISVHSFEGNLARKVQILPFKDNIKLSIALTPIFNPFIAETVYVVLGSFVK